VRTEGQVRHKLKQVQFRHLKKALRDSLSQRPECCVNNAILNTPNGDIRFCRLAAGDGSFVTCDEAHGGLVKAAGCPDFDCGNTREGVKEDFKRFLITSTIAEIAIRYPDISALMWVLGESHLEDLEESEPTTMVDPGFLTVSYTIPGLLPYTNPHPVYVHTTSWHITL